MDFSYKHEHIFWLAGSSLLGNTNIGLNYCSFHYSTLQSLYEVSVPFNESSQDINFSLDIIFIQTISRCWWLYVLTCLDIKLWRSLNNFYIYCHRLKFRIIVFLLSECLPYQWRNRGTSPADINWPYFTEIKLGSVSRHFSLLRKFSDFISTFILIN